MTSTWSPTISSTFVATVLRKPATAEDISVPSTVSMSEAALSTMPRIKSNIPANRLMMAPTGSLNTLAKKLAKVAIRL